MAKFGQVSVSSSPVKKFVEWKAGKDAGGVFSYYDKDMEKNIIIDIKEFIVLKTAVTVKGWHNASDSGIWSNETESMNDNLDVKSFKGGRVAYGLWKQIKPDVEAAGGKLHAAITVLHEGEIIELFFKGKAFAAWTDFLKSMNRNKNKVKYANKVSEKKGSVTFFVPVFEEGSVITDQEIIDATHAVDELNMYEIELRDKQDARTFEETEVKKDDEIDVNDLPFN